MDLQAAVSFFEWHTLQHTNMSLNTAKLKFVVNI